MHKSPARIARLLPLFALLLIAPTLAAQDTWSGVERIVAVGDVHGDCAQFVKTLRAAEVINDKDDWIAGRTHLVQVGDVLDRGPDSRKAMDLLMKLEKQAAAAGGAVHALIGNHEAMVLMNDWRYVNAAEEKAFGGTEPYRQAMSAAGLYGKWIRSHNTVIKINDLLFLHAGLTPTFAEKSLAELNKAVVDDIDKGEENGVAMAAFGPLWDRTLASSEPEELAKQLDPVLKKFGVSHMVVGHNVTREGVLPLAGGRLIRIDVGMSSFYGGPAACLVIEKGRFYEVRAVKGVVFGTNLAEGKRLLPVRASATQPAATTQQASRSAH